MENRYAQPQNFINREWSWLEFNRRVLEEAQDPSQPLLERLKFVSIFSSNLDEFFEIRVAGIKQQIESASNDMGPDHHTSAEVFQGIQVNAHELVETQYNLWNNELIPLLAEQKIRLLPVRELTRTKANWARRYFETEVLPTLTPLAVDASHPFPQVTNKSHNLIVRAKKPRQKQPLFAVVTVPTVVPRLIQLPNTKREADRWDYIYLADLIKAHIGQLFPGLAIEGVHAFRITRNSDLYIDEEESENLLRMIEEELRKTKRGNAVRLEVEADIPPDFQALLLTRFQLTETDLYKIHGPLSFTHLNPLIFNEAFGRLRDRPFSPTYDASFPRHADPFAVLKKQDVLLHHPYQSFDSVVRFLEAAAKDPKVLAIKMTLYRTSGDSPIVGALMDAAKRGKQVTALVELKARFDEANNIQWARRLEEAGAHVVYGVVGLKTHCKILLVVRRDSDKIRHYAHLGTGNYHPRTARIYTDLSLLTANPAITGEMATLFNTLTGLAEYPGFKKLMVAPFDLAARFKAMIIRETRLARSGKPGRIIIKINSLVDEDLIEHLYEASTAGVKIDLIVRGICCLRPGLRGVSENIRVISVVGRFLEHSRIFYFANNGKPNVYLGSADWMPRNFYRRVEVCFPVEDPVLRNQIIDEMLPAFLNDRIKARELQPDGSYLRLKPIPGQKPGQAQLFFRKQARDRTLPPVKQSASPATTRRLIPLERPPGTEAPAVRTL